MNIGGIKSPTTCWRIQNKASALAQSVRYFLQPAEGNFNCRQNVDNSIRPDSFSLRLKTRLQLLVAQIGQILLLDQWPITLQTICSANTPSLQFSPLPRAPLHLSAPPNPRPGHKVHHTAQRESLCRPEPEKKAQILYTPVAQYYSVNMTDEEFDAWFDETIERLAEEDKDILKALS
jgi:hypothetical protein